VNTETPTTSDIPVTTQTTSTVSDPSTDLAASSSEIEQHDDENNTIENNSLPNPKRRKPASRSKSIAVGQSIEKVTQAANVGNEGTAEKQNQKSKKTKVTPTGNSTNYLLLFKFY